VVSLSAATDIGSTPNPIQVDAGTLNFSGRAVTIEEANATQLAGTNTADSLSLTSGGDITEAASATLLVANNASFSAGDHAITLTNAGANKFGSLTFSGGAVTIVEADATQLTGANKATDFLSLTSGGPITEAPGATLSVTNNASFSAGANAITLTNLGANRFGSLTFNTSSAVTINAEGDTVLTGSSTADSLKLASTGSITDVPGISLAVTGNASFAGSSIKLGSPNLGLHDGIDFGSLTFSSPGAVSIQEASATKLSGASNADSLTLIANGEIANEPLASLSVTKNANLKADIITLDGINHFGSLTFNGAAVTIKEADATQLFGANTATNSLSLTSGGDITEAAGATLAVTNNANFAAGSNAITLTNAGANSFGNLTVSGGAVTIAEADATQFAGASSATSLSLTSGGAITEAGGATLAVTNNASFAAGSNAITLTNAGANNFGTLTFSGGAVAIAEASATQLAGANTASSLSLTSGGAITEAAGATLSVTNNASFAAGAMRSR
jgi:hypothetical protein